MTGIVVLGIGGLKVENDKCKKSIVLGLFQKHHITEERKKNIYIGIIAIVVSSATTLFIQEKLQSAKERADYKLSYQISAKPYTFEKQFLLFKKQYPATAVEIKIQNLGRKTQTSVGLYVRFKEAILFTYVPKDLPIYDNEGNSLYGEYMAFKGENSAGINFSMIPSGIKFAITFILDCQHSKGMEKEVVEFITLASGQE